jgi:hypothetical protein
MKAIASINFVLAAALLTFSVSDLAAASLGTAFTYEGRLTEGTNAANGNYDLIFSLYASDTGTDSLASPLTNSAVVVSNGLFVTTLDFGAGMLTSTNAWLETSVRTNGSGAFTTLAPRQNLPSVPYSVRAAYADALNGVLPTFGLAGSYTNALALNNAANSFSGNGAGLTGVNASTLGGMASTSFWQLGGNAGTVDGVNFVGTTDNEPLELKVNGLRALRLEPNDNGAPNVVGGAPVNLVDPGTVGAIIGGGGAVMYNGFSYTNEVASDFGTIGGGLGNTIWPDSPGASIGGGYLNLVYGTNSTIAGGCSNLVQNGSDFIGGGVQNSITELGAAYQFPTYIDGYDGSTIGGGIQNSIESGVPFEYITPAGLNTIGGGCGNRIEAGWPAGLAMGDTISGGVTNAIVGGSAYNTISGGSGNSIEQADNQTENNTIGGGSDNTIAGGEFDYDCTISGGSGNMVGGSSLFWYGCTIGGGEENIVDGYDALIAGGWQNMILTVPFVENFSSAIGGGEMNLIQYSDCATISGGQSNSIYGDFGTIPGGQSNMATNYCFAAGRNANATNSGAFVWSDSSGFDFYSTNTNEFAARCTGGARFVSAIDANGVPIAGVQLPAGGGSWSSLSDRNAKENFAPINPRDVLDQVDRMPITTWNYKSQDAAIRHIGPMAQDFAAAFRVGESDRTISTVDADGVALAAIQGLDQKVEEQLKAKEAEIKQLKQSVAELKALVNTLAQKPNGGGE